MKKRLRKTITEKVTFLTVEGEGRSATPKGRFMFETSRQGRYSRNEGFALVYKGAKERTLLCRDIITANPQLISDAWIDRNKDKFEACGEEDLTIKKEHANFPYFGITPFSLLQKLGISVSCRTKDGFTALSQSGSIPSALASLVH